MSTTSKLVAVSDDLATVRNLIECVFMACDALPHPHRGALAATVDVVTDKLKAVEDRLQAIRDRHGKRAGKTRDAA